MCGCDTDIPTGADGANGKTILNGTGVPAPSLGTDGDFYYDTATTDFYGPRTAGAWGSPVTLEGTDGINGTNGINGTSAIIFTKEFVGMSSGAQTLMTNAELISAGFLNGGHPQEFQVQLWVDSGGLSIDITSHPIILDFSGTDTIFVNIASGDLIANFLIPIVAPDVVRLVILG